MTRRRKRRAIPSPSTTEELTAALLATIPPDIVEAMSPQMRKVLAVQARRAEECARAGEDAAQAVADADPAARDPHTPHTPLHFVKSRAEYRAERSFWNEGGPQMTRTVDDHIAAAGIEVPVRIHYPTAEAVLPGIVFLHGGGFTVGDLDTHDRIMRVIAANSGAAVVGVDYSLSPEARFPQALHESAGVIARLVAHCRDYGIDGDRIAVAGDSAGAMLTLGAALLLRDDPGSIGLEQTTFASLRSLLLFYGGHGLIDSASRRLFGGAWDGMGTDDLETILSVYFTSALQANLPEVFHLEADLSGLPPVFVAAAGLDPLRDDSRALAGRLRRAGNDAVFEEYPQVLHSFLHFGRMLDDTNDVLDKAAAFAAAHLTEL